jgi:hypothetical protein
MAHHHGTASQFLHHGVGLHMIGVRVAAKNDLDVGHLEADLLHGGLEQGQPSPRNWY